MSRSNLYTIYNKRIISEYLLKDAICKGFSIHTPKALSIWEMLLNCLLECFHNEFGEISIVRTLPQTTPIQFLEDFYNDRFNRIEERIPYYTNRQGERMSVVTDALPYLFSKLGDSEVLFSTYTVVRPRTFGVKALLRDEFIRYFQFIITADVNSREELLNKLGNAISSFFYKTRIAYVAVDRHSDSYYLKKSCMHALWLNGNIESILQCGIIKKREDSMRANGKIVIDVGGAQRLLAMFIYNNSDSFGLFLPYSLRDYDIIIRAEHKTDILKFYAENASSMGCRIKYVPEDLSLNKVKEIAISDSAIAIVVKRKVNEKNFITIYNRDMTSSDLFSNEDVMEWISHKAYFLEKNLYQQQQIQIQSKIVNDNLYYKKNKYYRLIKKGIFI